MFSVRSLFGAVSWKLLLLTYQRNVDAAILFINCKHTVIYWKNNKTITINDICKGSRKVIYPGAWDDFRFGDPGQVSFFYLSSDELANIFVSISPTLLQQHNRLQTPDVTKDEAHYKLVSHTKLFLRNLFSVNTKR